MTDPFVTVEQFEFLPEAQVLRMHLESEGFQARLLDAETVSTEWVLGNAIGYIKLQVPQSRAAEAKAILQKLRELRESRREAAALEPESTRCLSCDADLQPDLATCPKCGWSYADDANSLMLGDTEEVGADDAGTFLPARTPMDQSTSVLNSLRTLKGPMILLILIPILASLAVAVSFTVLSMLRYVVGD